MTEKIRASRYDKPVPEPHYIPGYTGHCPYLHEYIGMTYPWATHAIIDDNPHCGGRLSPMKAPKRMRVTQRSRSIVAQDDTDDRIIKERRAAQKHPVLGTDIAIGYRGHVPKEREFIGKTQQPVYRQCIAEFERQQRRERGFGCDGGGFGALEKICFCCEHCKCRQVG